MSKEEKKPKVEYSVELTDQILETMGCCIDSIEKLCADNKGKGWPCPTTWYSWCKKHEELGEAYEIAKMRRAERHAHEALKIAEAVSLDPSQAKIAMAAVNKAQLRARLHMRFAAALDRDTWADRRSHDVAGRAGGPAIPLAELVKSAQADQPQGPPDAGG